jgi:hypothetical protein
MSDRELVDQVAALLREHRQTEREFIDRLLTEYYRTQETLIDRLFDRLETLLAARPPQPPAAPPPRVN